MEETTRQVFLITGVIGMCAIFMMSFHLFIKYWICLIKKQFEDFDKDLVSKQEDLDLEMAEVVNKNFWSLVDDETDEKMLKIIEKYKIDPNKWTDRYKLAEVMLEMTREEKETVISHTTRRISSWSKEDREWVDNFLRDYEEKEKDE